MTHPTTNTPSAASDRRLKVALLCHSDNLGGASVVTRRLMHALKAEGVDARMVVFSKVTEDGSVSLVGNRLKRGLTFISERINIGLNNGFSRENLFKVSTASSGMPLHRHPWVREADIVVLSWINQGMLSLSGIKKIARLGKPIVWVMHDMWNLTGICHHAYECDNYKRQCGKCKFLTGTGQADLSHRVWLKKKHLYDHAPITFVAVSHWLAERCRESSLLGNADVRVIPNAFPVDFFTTEPTSTLHRIPDSAKVVVMGAARLDDPIKGLDMAIEALNYIFDNHPDKARNSVAVFFGSVRNPAVFDKLRFPHQLMGVITDSRLLRQLYARADAVLSTSFYETLPGTLIEGMASGCLSVTFGHGGQTDIVDHLTSGYIAKYRDPIDIARGIMWAFDQHVDRPALHEEVRRRFSSKAVAQSFIELFGELLAKK